MAVSNDIRAIGTSVEKRRLLRRLMIKCPVTGLPSDTGFELTALPSAGMSNQWLLDCLECGQDHEWQPEDLVLG
jgi:hypothetical protein